MMTRFFHATGCLPIPRILSHIFTSKATLALTICLFSTCLLPAQSNSSETSPLRLRFLAFEPSHATNQAFLHDPKAPDTTKGIPAPIKSYLNHEAVFATTTSRKIILTKSPERNSLKNPDQWLGETTVPNSIKSAVVLCLPEMPSSKKTFRLVLIDDSNKAFPPGSYHVTNLSSSQVRIELEKRPWVIQPGATELITNPPLRDGNQSGMKAFALENQYWRRIASGIWPQPGNGRVIQLLYYHPVAKQVQLRAFDDVPPADDPVPIPTHTAPLP